MELFEYLAFSVSQLMHSRNFTKFDTKPAFTPPNILVRKTLKHTEKLNFIAPFPRPSSHHLDSIINL